MNPEIFASWLQKQGHSVINENGWLWYQAGFRTLQSFPYHWCIKPSDKQLEELLIKRGTIALRYSTDIYQPIGKVSYHVVYDKKCMEFHGLPKKVRNDVRSGLNYATVEPISFSRLASEGWQLRLQTLQRQGRVGAESEQEWRNLCLSADGLPGFEAWGAIHEGQLVASILVFAMDECCSILYQQSATEHMKYGINNAIAFVFTNEALSRPGVTRIFYGLHSLDAPSSVDDFKFRMGYFPQPVRQRVVFHPVIAPLINQHSFQVVKTLVNKYSNYPQLHKIEGMFRFYLQGNRPLGEQDWPESLVEQKSDVLMRAMPHVKNLIPSPSASVTKSFSSN